MKNLQVTKKYEGKKLSKFLIENIPNLTENLFYKTLRKKDIKVNGKRVNKNIEVYEKDEIEIRDLENVKTHQIVVPETVEE